MLTSLSRLTRFAGSAAGAIEKATPTVLGVVKVVSGRRKVKDLSPHDMLDVLTFL